jgi:capsular polysaccharide biosynthesis protein
MGIVYTLTMVTPKYESSTTLILAKIETTTTETSSDSITQADITLNQKLISTYKEIIKTKSVLRQVIENLGIDITEAQLEKNISIELKNDTDVIEITVTNENPVYAANIANELANVFPNEVARLYSINNISIIDKAEVSETPCNVHHSKDVLIFAFIGIVVSAVYALVANMVDTTIKTQEDIEKNTKLTVLAEIPLYESEVPVKKGGKK